MNKFYAVLMGITSGFGGFFIEQHYYPDPFWTNVICAVIFGLVITGGVLQDD